MLKIVKTSALRLLTSMGQRQSPFLTEEYRRHTSRRLEHLACLGLDVAGRSVLELGCGVGELTSYYVDRGCRVLATDARLSNVMAVRSRFPDCEVAQVSLANRSSLPAERFDVVHAYGLLYHLHDPESAVEAMSSCCGGLLLLESVVHPTAFGPNPTQEDGSDPTQAVDGIGSRPGREWLYDLLKKHFEYVYVPYTQPRHEEFPLDWSEVPSGRHSRCVFVCSRVKLDCRTLTLDLLARHLPQP